MSNLYQSTFKRCELKYMLEDSTYRQFKERISDYFIEDHFGRTKICNIYFDTPEHIMVKRSLEKPIYKEKLRLRSYGIPSFSSQVFIEVKKKYKGIVYKRREDMTLHEAKQYLYERKDCYKQTQITQEIDWFLRQYEKIEPSMYISYERFALSGKEDENLRITFDHNLLWREVDLDLEQGIWGDELLKPEQKLMEIKIPQAMPIWLSQILSELKIYPVSYSKYGKAFLKAEKKRIEQKSYIKNKIKKGERIYA